MTNGELVRIRNKCMCPNLGAILASPLERLRNTAKNTREDSQFPDKYSNQAPSEYKSRAFLLGHPLR